MGERSRRILDLCKLARLEDEYSREEDASEIDPFVDFDSSSDNYEPSSESEKDDSLSSDDSVIPPSVCLRVHLTQKASPLEVNTTTSSSGQTSAADLSSIITSSELDCSVQGVPENGEEPEGTGREELPLKKRRRPWQKQIRQEKRLRGESYIGFRGVQYPSRPMLPAPCSNKRKHTCLLNVNEEQRLKIYNDYRSLSTIDDQRKFIAQHVSQAPKKRNTTNTDLSRRANTFQYTLTVGEIKVIVCREFFMATLNATDAMLRTSIKKISETGIVEPDQRGRHAPINKLSPEREADIKEFINSFPTMQSHYCRSNTSRKYFESSLNVTIMHSMHKKHCEKKHLPTVSIETFRKIFRTFNVGFFIPKKDQCRKCLVFQGLSEEEKGCQQQDYNAHLERKNAARRERNNDKILSINNDSFLAFNFDLEAVLNVPKGSAGQIFYLRKLAVYNLTIFDLKNHDGDCYLWDESQGRRGANEIASCLHLYLKNRCRSNVTVVHMMSDSCGGQNKNSFVLAMCIHTLKSVPSLKAIRHSFFEVGHSEMECDSMHSKIEKKSKSVPVYTPEGWAQIIRMARSSPSPFIVHPLTFQDFLTFKTSKFEIPWRKVCSYEVRKEEEEKIRVFYKIDYDGVYTEATPKRHRGRPSREELEPSRTYSQQLKISDAKYKDLMKMCKDLTIPKEYHTFFQSLKSSITVLDRLPDPHISEESDYEEEN